MATPESLQVHLDRGNNPASSTSARFLRMSDQDDKENVNEDPNYAPELGSTADITTTADSSPYMRSSLQDLPSESRIHECPPESSSPFLSSSSSGCFSPYFPVIGFFENTYSSGSSSSNVDDSDRDLSEIGILEELALFPPVCYNLWLPIKNRIFGRQPSRDEFSRCLYDRLLAVERERELADKSVNCHEGNVGSTTLYEDAGPVLPQQDDSLTCSGFSTTSSASETDIETPFFASPPGSDNLTPPKHRKRTRESCAGESFSNNAVQGGNKENQNPEQAPYRLIWRAQSFEAYQNRRLQKEDWEHDAPPLKRQRTYIYPLQQEYASKPASLRRALSLKSECEQTPDSASSQDLTPTEPATPVASTRSPHDSSFFAYSVPIIAPPPDHVAALPISTETVAKTRISRFLERESVTRKADGLDIFCNQTVDYVPLPQNDMWEELLAIGRSCREEVIGWLLYVLPTEPTGCDSTPASSFSSTLSHSSQGSTSSLQADLYDELSSSPETRFHAASIFLRFFYRIMSEESNLDHATFRNGTACFVRAKNTHRSMSLAEKEGKKLIIWDVAVASLALSVKLHRDVLKPLSPILAQEYIDLAHHRMSFDDLEAAHRDILSTLSYDLGLTPQPLLDNLWSALPSLRQLFEYEGGWNLVLRETWLHLFDVISESAILQFPLSSITVACLIEGIISALVHNHDYRLTWRRLIARKQDGKDGKERNKTKKKEALKKAEEQAEGVIHDIQAVTGVTDARLLECRTRLIRISEVPGSD